MDLPEVANLAVAMLTPLAVLALGLLVARNARRVESSHLSWVLSEVGHWLDPHLINRITPRVDDHKPVRSTGPIA